MLYETSVGWLSAGVLSARDFVPDNRILGGQD